MKFRLILIAIGFAAGINCYAQSYPQSDTLLIKLKNGTVEKIAVSQIKKIQFENVTAGVEDAVSSNSLQVKGNYPNPFEEKTNIEFEIESAGEVQITIYDSKGNQIQTLERNDCQAGKNSLQWNGIDKAGNKASSGVYYYEVRYGKATQARKMIIVGGGK